MVEFLGRSLAVRYWPGNKPSNFHETKRVFSAAGKMHGDLQKSAKDSTLEHSLRALFAAFNTE